MSNKKEISVSFSFNNPLYKLSHNTVQTPPLSFSSTSVSTLFRDFFVTEKSFILDLKIDLNNNTIIDLEMQVSNLGNWPERSVSYLARTYDNLSKGSDYENVKTAYHIGFLDYTLFKDYPEFFAKYQLLNIKNHNLYTSKFNLFVVDLTQTELATNEDIENGLYYWAKLFKAKTWEELRIIAEENKTLQSTSQILFKYNNDENMKEYCRRREDAIAWETSAKEKISTLTAENAEKDAIIADKDAIIADNAAIIARLTQELMETRKL